MFERFTDSARKAWTIAHQEAQRYDHKNIGTEHILIGLVKEDTGDGDALRRVRMEVEKFADKGTGTVMMDKLQLSLHAKKVIEYAIYEARNLKHDYVGMEHLLLGLLREENSVAFKVLKILESQQGSIWKRIPPQYRSST